MMEICNCLQQCISKGCYQFLAYSLPYVSKRVALNLQLPAEMYWSMIAINLRLMRYLVLANG